MTPRSRRSAMCGSGPSRSRPVTALPGGGDKLALKLQSGPVVPPGPGFHLAFDRAEPRGGGSLPCRGAARRRQRRGRAGPAPTLWRDLLRGIRARSGWAQARGRVSVIELGAPSRHSAAETRRMSSEPGSSGTARSGDIMDLKGAVAVVTGGNGGLGQRICHALASRGATSRWSMRSSAMPPGASRTSVSASTASRPRRLPAT